MKVHIVCKEQDEGHIIHRMAVSLADNTGWSLGSAPRRDVNLVNMRNRRYPRLYFWCSIIRRATIALRGITGEAKRLKVMDAVAAAARDRFDMISGQQGLSPAAQAAMTCSLTKHLPFSDAMIAGRCILSGYVAVLMLITQRLSLRLFDVLSDMGFVFGALSEFFAISFHVKSAVWMMRCAVLALIVMLITLPVRRLSLCFHAVDAVDLQTVFRVLVLPVVFAERYSAAVGARFEIRKGVLNRADGGRIGHGCASNQAYSPRRLHPRGGQNSAYYYTKKQRIRL